VHAQFAVDGLIAGFGEDRRESCVSCVLCATIATSGRLAGAACLRARNAPTPRNRMHAMPRTPWWQSGVNGERLAAELCACGARDELRGDEGPCAP
jgi:hypothetical protein